MKLEIEEHRHKKVPAFGKCIYCGAIESEVRLTDEHIVPYSLGGTSVLLKATCEECAAVTSKLELHLARAIFGHYRIHANTATRRPKHRPNTLPLTIAIGGDQPRNLDVPISDHPFFTWLPVWKPPGILTQAVPSADFGTKELHRYDFIPKNFRESFRIADTEAFRLDVSFKLDENQFSRALAKIGYCEAIARYGLNGFDRSVIVEFILGRYPFAQFLAGGTEAEVLPPLPKNIDHAIALAEIPTAETPIILAIIRLFASAGTPTHGMPVYTVAIGCLPSLHAQLD